MCARITFTLMNFLDESLHQIFIEVKMKTNAHQSNYVGIIMEKNHTITSQHHTEIQTGCCHELLMIGSMASALHPFPT